MIIVPSDYETWARLAAEMTAELSALLPDAEIAHIGSTAVPGFPAKPVVDLAVGVPADGIAHAARTLAAHGFDLEGERAGHAWLSHPRRTARAFVIHVFDRHGEEWERRLRFRDILRHDEDARERYLAVKRAAADQANGWGEYTRAKAAVVAEILDSAAPPAQRSPATSTGSDTGRRQTNARQS